MPMFTPRTPSPTGRLAVEGPASYLDLEGKVRVTTPPLGMVDTHGSLHFRDFRESVARAVGLPQAQFTLYGQVHQSHVASALDNPGCAFHALLACSEEEALFSNEQCKALANDFNAFEEKAREQLEPEHFGLYGRLKKLFNTQSAGAGCVSMEHPHRAARGRKMYAPGVYAMN